MNVIKSLAPALLSALICAGCATFEPPKPDDPYYAPVIPDMPEMKVVETGSLFHPGQHQNLYSDIKARRVGDIITVTLEERTQAQKNAKTELDKSSSIDITTPTFGGDPITFNGNELSVGIDTDNEFDGESKGNQSNSLTGSISVNVVQVLANGNLVVRGEKWITINSGDEYLRLTGIIRPDDIDPSNSIPSQRVANARIQYSGTGAFSETQQQGWLSRFFNSPLWPL